MALAERKLRDSGDLQIVRPVIAGARAVVAERVGPIEVEGRVAVVVVRDGFGKRIRRRNLEPARETPLRMRLQRVVIRGAEGSHSARIRRAAPQDVERAPRCTGTFPFAPSGRNR